MREWRFLSIFTVYEFDTGCSILVESARHSPTLRVNESVVESLIHHIPVRMRTAIFYGMVPLAILNGWPSMACSCANGQSNPSGRGAVCCALHSGAGQKGSGSSCCGCPCCAERGGDSSRHGCCPPPTKKCCQPSNKPSPGGRQAGSPNHGCTLVIQMQPIPGVVAASQYNDQYDVLALFVVPLNLARPLATSQTSACVEIDSDPPPDNLVVTLQRLVI